MTTTESIKLVKSAIRTMAFFSAFADTKKPMTLGELAKSLDMPKSSCHELLQTLIHLGYVLIIEDGSRYYPSRRLWEMAEQINQFNPVKEHIQAVLKHLRDDTGETIFIGKRQGQKVVYSEVFDGTHTIRYSAQSGDIKSIHASALGKALLGSMSKEQMQSVLNSLKLTRFNSNTITSKTKLKEHLEASNRQGVFVTRGEHELDVIGIAVAVIVQGYPLAIGMAGPSARMEKYMRQYIAALKRVAEEISN